MAQINVEHKKKNVWPWIIGAIVAAVIIWAVIQLFDDDAVGAVTTLPAQSSSAPIPNQPATTAHWTQDAAGAEFA